MLDLLIFSAGLCIGSFLNVCILRIPEGEPLVWSRSRCPRCRHPIVAYDNIPLLSFLLLAGRCRHCSGRISFRYPAVELLTGLVFWGLWRRWAGYGPWFVCACAASCVLIVVAGIDWDTFLIPDVLSLGLAGLALPCAAINPYFFGGLWRRVAESAAGGVVGFLICWITAEAGARLFKKEAMGGGDVKLLTAIGAWTGALGALDALMMASFLGLFYSIPLMARGKLRRHDPIPFGPFLSAGAIAEFFYALPFLNAALRIMEFPLRLN